MRPFTTYPAGQRDIEQHKMVVPLLDHGECLAGGGHFAADGNLGLVRQHLSQPLAKDLRIID